MHSWVVVSIAVVAATAVSAKPLSRLRRPERNDRLRIALSIAIVAAAAVFACTRSRAHKVRRAYRASGGAQCTFRSMPVRDVAGGGYTPYVVPDDLAVGGGPAPVLTTTVPQTTTLTAIAEVPTYPEPIGVPAPVAADVVAGDVVVGGTLRLVGDF